MKKWFVILIVMIAMLPLVQGICCERGKECIISEPCQDGDCGVCSISVYERSGNTRIPFIDMVNITRFTYIHNATTNFSTYGTYPYSINCTTAEVCQGDCYVEVKQECEVQDMASLAIMLFVMAINALMFIIAFKFDFSKNEIANFIIKRCIILIGVFFLSLNTGILATIADNAGIDVLDELFRYLWLINWTIYFAVLALGISFIFKTMDLWKDISRRKRFGEDEE